MATGRLQRGASYPGLLSDSGCNAPPIGRVDYDGVVRVGPLDGLPATGTPVEMRGITIWRIVDGKIREEWSCFDELGAYSQLLHHVEGKLWIALGVFLVLVVAAERLL
jgi:SnoaL-like polyketide cyclase